MTPHFRAGAVVAWWDGQELAFGVVGGEEKQRYRLVIPRGHEARIKPQRILVEVAAPGAVPGTAIEERRRAGDRAAAVAERVQAQAGEVDVALLWEIVIESGPAPREPQELADLALGSSHGDAVAAVVLALLADGLRFVRKGDAWEPREPPAVAELLEERRRVARRQQETEALFARVASAARGQPAAELGTDTERRYLDALEQLAVYEESAPESAVALAQTALHESGLKFDRPHEGAFRLLRILGRFDSDDQNLQLVRYRLEVGFPADVEAAARAAAAAGAAPGKRRDLTDAVAISIDGPRTREIDDLLSIERLSSGGFRLGVHIADAAAFVTPDDVLDRVALDRSITRYMPDCKVLMLPAAVSEEAASLAEGQVKPALSFLLELEPDGELGEVEVVRSTVRSHGRLDYTGADRALGRGEGPFVELLVSLVEMAGLREQTRIRSGAVPLHTPEVEVYVPEDRVPRLERLSGDSPSRRAVTESMIVAGEAVARFCREARVPAIYRRQSFQGDGVPDVPDTGVTDPVEVRRVRRLLRRAEASLEPGSHASLGLDAYAQATSPLRRYQDLATHRQILSVLEGRAPFYDTASLQRIAATTEQAEIEARQAERRTDEYWLLRYLEGQVGSECEARVVQTEPRTVVQLVESLREQPMPSLSGVELGQTVRVRIERANPRAGLLVLRRA